MIGKEIATLDTNENTPYCFPIAALEYGWDTGPPVKITFAMETV